MWHCFEKISIFKPNTSRPANSERYLVCKHRKNSVSRIRDHLFSANRKLNQLGLDKTGNFKSRSGKDLIGLLDCPYSEEFRNHLIDSNESIAKNQIVALSKIAAFTKDPSLVETRQGSLRSECLALWEVPNESRRVAPRETPEAKFKSIMKSYSNSEIKSMVDSVLDPKGPLDVSTFEKEFESIYDWKCVFVSGEQRGFYIGSSRNTYKVSFTPDSIISIILLLLYANRLD